MLDWWKLLPPEVPIAGRMALAYGDIFVADLASAGATFKRRALALALCAISALLALATGMTWLIAATWNTPFRYGVLGGLTLGFGVITAVAGSYGRLWGRFDPVPFENLRGEWQQDREELLTLMRSAPDANGRRSQ